MTSFPFRTIVAIPQTKWFGLYQPPASEYLAASSAPQAGERGATGVSSPLLRNKARRPEFGYSWWYVGLIWLLLSACQSEQAGSADPPNAPAPAPEAAAETTMIAYYQLRGELAGEAVTFDLLREDNVAYPEYGYFRGFYRYDRFGGPIALYGSIDSNGFLILTEQGGYDQESHTLKGKWSEGTYTGRWLSGNGKDNHPFALYPAQDGYLPLQPREEVDSLVAFPAWPSSPQANFRAYWLSPQGEDSALNAFVESAVAAGLSSEKLAHSSATIPLALQRAKKIFFEDYRREMLSLYREGLLDSASQEDYMPYSYMYEKSVMVYFNDMELLTLGFTDYSYTGGAHGIYATEVKSYDLAARKQIMLDEILLPGYERTLSEALARALRIKYQLDDNAPLSEVLFEDKLEPNENFGLTDKGIFFVYQPYEIAAYALGEIELFVSFERIQDFVRKEEPQKNE